MAESQDIEYKAKWKDEYLKWICGFANANGGKIFIGKSDKGEIVGVDNAKKLLEDIPNKVRDILGILVDVDLRKTEKGNFIEITIEAYPHPVNYKGQYHYRSGSTKQELKGSALDKFLIKKMGIRWESVIVPNTKTEDLQKSTIDFYKDRGAKSKRLAENLKDDKQLLENLKLTENNQLKRS